MLTPLRNVATKARMLSQLIINGIIAGSVYALVALGFGLIYSVGHFFHFAHGAIYTIGAYTTYIFVARLNVPLPLAVILGLILTSLLGVGVELSIYKPLRKKKVSSLILLIASLGIFTALQNVIALVFGTSTKSIRSWNTAEGISLLGGNITPIQIAIVVINLMLCLGVWGFIRTTRMGRMIRAVANDPQLSRYVGIDSDRILLFVFALSSFLGAVAGILVSFDTDMTPTMGFNVLFGGVVAVIIGGYGSVPGALLGGMLVGLAQNLGVWKLPTQWQDAIVFLILILFLIVKPQGIFGKAIRINPVQS